MALTMATGPIIEMLRHPKEKAYGGALAVIGAIVWLLVAGALALVLVNGNVTQFVIIAGEILLYGLIFGLVVLIGAAFYRAYAFGHFVMVSETQFPHFHRMVAEGAAHLGMPVAPRAFVYNSNGVINAFARRLLGGRYVFLTSSLIDADTDAQVRFVIGHELGHHAAGHLNPWKILLKFPGHIVPFLGPAYSRARELTCDRVGAYLCQDLDASRKALQMLACGSARLNSHLNPEAFEAQEQMVPGFTGWLLLILSGYPRHTQRVIALRDYAAQSAAR